MLIMKNFSMRSARSFLSIAVFLATAPIGSAATYTLTTKGTEGGFDGWCSAFWGGKTSDFGPDSKGEILNAGNLRPTAFDRSAAILMFDLSAIKDLNPADIVSAELSYFVVEAHGSPKLTITHGTKTEPRLIRGKDNAQSANTAIWISIGTATARREQVGTIDVTNSLVADLSEGNFYSSYRIVQEETFEKKRSVFPYGSRIASSENATGYPVPTLTIMTR